ncbi:MAG: hypothetical protein KBD78_09550 [Oligoflexales bacterium]|nr:hypothetical protein [Oligoflexales bacterium]
MSFKILNIKSLVQIYPAIVIILSSTLGIPAYSRVLELPPSGTEKFNFGPNLNQCLLSYNQSPLEDHTILKSPSSLEGCYESFQNLLFTQEGQKIFLDQWAFAEMLS